MGGFFSLNNPLFSRLGGGSSSSTPLLSKTWAQLNTLRLASQLVPGQMYLLTDYQTIYDRPDYTITGTAKAAGSITNVNSGVTEPLILIAITTSSFGEDVISTLYPQDLIKFVFNFTTTRKGVVTKGFIYSRTDTLLGNSFDCDYRTITLKRYIDSNGDYSSYKDLGGASTLLPVISGGFQVVSNCGTLPKTFFGGVFDLANNVYSGPVMQQNNFGFAQNCTITPANNGYSNYFINSVLRGVVSTGDFYNNIASGASIDNFVANNNATVYKNDFSNAIVTNVTFEPNAVFTNCLFNTGAYFTDVTSVFNLQWSKIFYFRTEDISGMYISNSQLNFNNCTFQASASIFDLYFDFNEADYLQSVDFSAATVIYDTTSSKRIIWTDSVYRIIRVNAVTGVNIINDLTD